MLKIMDDWTAQLDYGGQVDIISIWYCSLS